MKVKFNVGLWVGELIENNFKQFYEGFCLIFINFHFTEIFGSEIMHFIQNYVINQKTDQFNVFALFI